MFKSFLNRGDLILANIIDSYPFIQRKRLMRWWIKRIKERERCQICGAPVTEFHHTGKKTMKINAMVRKACNMTRLINELKLTVPLCHDCHVIETRKARQNDLIK